MKSGLLSIDCGLQKSLHDLSSFKERLANISSESHTQSTCHNHEDIINQQVMNDQMLSLKKAVACKQAELEQVLAEKKSMAIRVESLEVLFKLYVYLMFVQSIVYFYNHFKIILDEIEKRSKCSYKC